MISDKYKETFQYMLHQAYLYLEEKTDIENKEWILVGRIVITHNKNNSSKGVWKLDVEK